MSELYPDELPLWFAVPAGIVLWAAWISICLRDARASRRQTQGSRW